MLSRPRIRQLTLGELLDESFRMYRRDLLTLIALAALVIVPYTLVNFFITLPLQQGLAQLQNTAPGAVPDDQIFADFFSSALYGVGLSSILGLLYVVVFLPLMEGALTRAVTRRYLDQPVTVGDSIGGALRHAVPLIVAKLLPSLGLLALSIAFVACIFFAVGGAALGGTAALGGGSSGEISPGVGVGLGVAIFFLGFALVIGFIALIAFLYVRFLFTSQAVIAENKGPIEALSRSWNLTKGYFWRTFGIFLLIGLLVFLVQLVPSSILGAILGVSLATNNEPNFVQQQVLSSIISAITQVLVTPFQLVAFTLMYYDLRIRKEGFDLEYQAQSLLGGPNYGQPLQS